MSSDSTTQNGHRDPAAIEADIIRQRAQLAETVDALSERLDVKARVEHKVADIKNNATTASGRPRPSLVLAAAATVAGVALLVWWRRAS